MPTPPFRGLPPRPPLRPPNSGGLVYSATSVGGCPLAQVRTAPAIDAAATIPGPE